MALPAPSLDDRRFQDLVDDAKRMLQQRIPAWTDHNVHDPGVTLIELFAWMTDQLVYRLNRVPDRLYVKFLELIGVQLLAPSAARVPQTFWLSAAQAQPIVVVPGTEVATPRVGSEDPLIFATVEPLTIVPCELETCASELADTTTHRHADAIKKGTAFACFAALPAPGDAFYVGLTAATPSNAVTIRMDCRVEGVGVDPRDPPLIWEAWTADGWMPCDVDHDDTGGLNRAGDLVLHVPTGHVASLVQEKRAGWLRARVLEAREGQPAYSSTPTIHAISAFTIGGTVDALNAAPHLGEVLGTSEGVPGQVFPIAHRPVVLDDDPVVLEVSDAQSSGELAGWAEWERVEDFSASGPDDRHFVLDPVAGEVRLGPAVREADGRLVQYGRLPSIGAALRLRSYRSGGGAAGNVAARAITVMRSSVPYLSTTENRKAARGGRDAEDIAEAQVRGPLLLQSRRRAVTASDYEVLALEAARDLARARAIPDPTTANAVRVLVVPVVGEGRLEFGQLLPRDQTLQAVADMLEPRRTVGTRVVVEPPVYQGVTVVARLRSVPLADAAEVQELAVRALYNYFHPTSGGPNRDGWPFGRTVHVGEVYGVLQRVRGVDLVEDARLFAADPVTGDRGQASQSIEIQANALVFSYEHQVRVTASAS